MLALLVLLATGPAAQADPSPAVSIAQASALFDQAVASNLNDISSFLALPCLSGSGKKIVRGLLGGTQLTQTSTQTEYKDYMAFVTKTMEGNGKCDGGFQGVAVEAGHRLDRSTQSRQKMAQIQQSFQTQAMANLFKPHIVYSDSKGEDCSDEADRLYAALESGAKKVDASIDQLQLSLRYEEEMFRQYQAKNDGLRVRCGDTPTDGNQLVRSAAAQGSVARVPSGTSRNPASSITGVQEDSAKRAKAEGLVQ